MSKTRTLERIREIGVLPVLRASSLDAATQLVDAIAEGGIPTVEVTMTVDGAIGLIGKLARERPDLLIGAGTVLDPETARLCILEGAKFVVSPGLNVKTIELCRRYSVPIMPGALTPTEVITAWQAGADVIKIFPASAMGGAKYLRSLRAPLPQVEMIPTGGVTSANAAEFLAAGAFAVGVGADLADESAIANGRRSDVVATAKAYVAAVAAARSHSAAS